MSGAEVTRILFRIVRESGLAIEQNHPLYAYRASEEAIEELRAHLRVRLRNGDRLVGGEPAAFVLFGAEYFARFHESGPWQWATILDPIEYQGTIPQLYPIVRSGLGFWRRTLLRHQRSNKYLLTLACEGGLPLQLLAGQQAHLRQYFRHLLLDYESFSDQDILSLAVRYQSDLPQTLQNDTVSQLAADLVQSICELRLLAKDADDPVEHLNRHHPNWEQLVPLRITDDVARSLLRGLLLEKRDVDREQGAIKVTVRLELTPVPRIIRSLRTPAVLPMKRLAELLNIPMDSLPGRFRLALDCGGRLTQAAGVTRRYLKDEFSIQEYSHAVPGFGSIRLAVTSGNRIFPSVEVEGGQELSPLPWVFRDDDLADLIAEGAVRTRTSQVLVALPFQWRCHPKDGAVVEELGQLLEQERIVLRVQGTASLEGDDERVMVRSGAQEEAAERFVLTGRSLRLGPGGTSVWVGCPQVRISVNEAATRVVPEMQLEWKPAHNASVDWNPVSRPPVGEILLRLRENGELRFRSPAMVMPREFSFRMRPGHDAGQGALELKGLGRAVIRVFQSDQFTAEVDAKDGIALVQVSSTGQPPATLALRIEYGEDSLANVVAAFPSRSTRFLGSDLTTDLSGTTCTLDQFQFAVARVVTPIIEGVYRLRAVSSQGTFILGRLAWVDDQTMELPLYSIHDAVRDLLTATADMDEDVQVDLVTDGAMGEHVAATLSVRRYDLRFVPRWDDRRRECRVTLDRESWERLTGRERTELRLEARQLQAPLSEPTILGRAEDSAWTFSTVDFEPGAWMITGWVGDRLRVRPLLVTVFPAVPTPKSEGIRGILELREAEDRARAYALRLEDLLDDGNHDDWNVVIDYLSTLPELPPTTFDLVARLPNSPAALIYALLLLTGSQRFEAIWEEMEGLPFLWSLVPISDWERAVECYLNAIKDLKSEQEAPFEIDPVGEVGAALKQLETKLLSTGHPIVSVIYQWFARKYSGFPEPRERTLAAIEQLVDIVTPPVLQELLRDHGEDEWPRVNRGDLATGGNFTIGDTDPYVLAAPNSFQSTIFNAPVIAAAFCAKGGHPGDILDFKRLRSFDQTWFDWIQALTVARILASQIGREENRDA